MAMRTASPYWLSLALWFGLLFVLVGERLIPLPSVQVIFTGIGVAIVGLVTAARVWTATNTSGPRRKIELALAGCHAATIAALVLYAMTTSWGPHALQDGRAKDMVTVVWAIVLVASVVPVILIEIALGFALRSQFDLEGDRRAEENVDLMRVRDSAWSGLSIAFAMGFLMVTCQVANERNITKDVSYFKTSMAGESTQNIVRASPQPVHALLFFPETNEATAFVKGYFDQLAHDAGNLEVSIHDRLAEADLAQKYRVTKDGVIVLARGEDESNAATIEIPKAELEKAEVLRRSDTLRTLDAKVNKKLLEIMRDKRKAYVIVGHGELNDPGSMPPDLKGRIPMLGVNLFRRQLAATHYEIKKLGLIDLVKDVPEDATMVILLAPTAPLQEAEWSALARYLDRGGRLLIALNRRGATSLGSLEGKLGVKLDPSGVTDDRAYLTGLARPPADRRFAVTTQFSAHASTTQLSRTVNKGLLMIDAGALEDAPFADPKAAPKKTITLRSMESSWLDRNDNFRFDSETEKRQRYTIGMAIEGPKLAGGKDGYRVLVFSNANLFGDLPIPGAGMVLPSGPLLRDSVLWLGGEEVFGGDIVSEEDTAIQHTKNEKAAWFILTVAGVPLAVLGLGLGGTLLARRRRAVGARTARKTEVTP